MHLFDTNTTTEPLLPKESFHCILGPGVRLREGQGRVQPGCAIGHMMDPLKFRIFSMFFEINGKMFEMRHGLRYVSTENKLRIYCRYI